MCAAWMAAMTRGASGNSKSAILELSLASQQAPCSLPQGAASRHRTGQAVNSNELNSGLRFSMRMSVCRVYVLVDPGNAGTCRRLRPRASAQYRPPASGAGDRRGLPHRGRLRLVESRAVADRELRVARTSSAPTSTSSRTSASRSTSSSKLNLVLKPARSTACAFSGCRSSTRPTPFR